MAIHSFVIQANIEKVVMSVDKHTYAGDSERKGKGWTGAKRSRGNSRMHDIQVLCIKQTRRIQDVQKCASFAEKREAMKAIWMVAQSSGIVRIGA